MSDDIIKRLREAIAAGPTPGYWDADFASAMRNGSPAVVEYFVRRDGDDISIAADIVDPSSGLPSAVNANYIAAASPDNIAALLDRLDDFEENGAQAVRWAPSSAHWSNELRRLFGPSAREGIESLEAKFRDATFRLDKAERENERLRDWNRQMVEKAASGGTLDDYRELGAKLAAAEAEIERLRATLSHPLLSPTHYCKDCRALWRQCDDFSFNARSTALCDACNNAPCGEQLLPLLPPQPIPAPVIRELNRLRAENEALAADARRYRWLRGDACPDHSVRWTQWEVRCWVAPFWSDDLRREGLDRSIDAAMAADRGDERREG